MTQELKAAAERQEIRRRRAACDASELDEHRKFAAAMLRIRTHRAYYEAECEHPEVKKIFQISHYEIRCTDCGKQLKAKDSAPCNPSS